MESKNRSMFCTTPLIDFVADQSITKERSPRKKMYYCLRVKRRRNCDLSKDFVKGIIFCNERHYSKEVKESNLNT